VNVKIVDMLTKLAINNPGVQGRFKMAAGIVYKKHLIATGVNSYKTHPLMLKPGYRDGQLFMHAEVDAIRNALRLVDAEDLSKCDIYVVRVKRPSKNSKNWIRALAEPCDGCARTIASFNFKNVFWTKDEVELV